MTNSSVSSQYLGAKIHVGPPLWKALEEKNIKNPKKMYVSVTSLFGHILAKRVIF